LQPFTGTLDPGEQLPVKLARWCFLKKKSADYWLVPDDFTEVLPD
jgi:hypothetical protein